MSKRYLLISAISLITLVLLCIPIQKVRAVGPIFEEGDNGFSVSSGTVLMFKFTNVSTLMTSTTGIKIGDGVRLKITATNNSITIYPDIYLNFWYADTIYGIIEYYNSTSGYGPFSSFPTTVIPLIYYNTSTGMLIGGYNYYDETGQYFIIPRNLTHANNTIVDQINNILTSISFTTPPGPTVKGNWIIWNGTVDGTTPNSQKYYYEYNSNGILIKHQAFMNGASGWDLIYEIQLEETEEIDLIDLLTLSAITGGGGAGLMLGDYIAIGFILAIIFVPLAIGLGIRKTSGK